jgi:capsular polysaccharide biosynthesis protein
MKDGFMHQQEERDYESVDLMAYANIAWKRRWQIIIPTIVIAVLAGIVSFLLPKIWEVDAIIIPSKFLSQTTAGEFKEILVAPPAQIAGQISQRTYDNLIAAELNIDPRTFPRINAENLRNTNLIRVYVRGKDPQRGRTILLALFNHLKSDFDKKIDVEFSSLNTAIDQKKNTISSEEKLLQIADQRIVSTLAEMKATKTRIERLDKEQQRVLSEKKDGAESLALLLYSNEIQQNLRYVNSLEESINAQRNIMENLRGSINNAKKDITLLEDKKARIDYAQLVKDPTPSFYPVSPKKKQNVIIAGFLAFFLSLGIGFFREYLEKQKKIGLPKAL